MDQRIIRTWKLSVSLLVMWAITGSFVPNTFGQNQAYSLKTGYLVEGAGGPVDAISVSLATTVSSRRQILMLDNGLKRTFISQNDIANEGVSSLSDTEIEIRQRESNSSPGYGIVMSSTPFDEFGHRTLWIRDRSGRTNPIIQGITRINPLWTEVKTLVNPEGSKDDWGMKLATSTIPANVLRNLLYKSIKDPTSPLERLDIVEFYLEAEQYRRAIEELAQIERDFPDARKDFADDRKKLKQEYGRQVLEEIRFRESVGQVQLATSMAEAIDTSEMSGELNADFADFLRQVKGDEAEVAAAKAELIARAKKFMADQPNEADVQMAMTRLIDDVESDLSISNLNRLDSYRRVLTDKDQTDEQLAALAISGWLLGSNNAIDNFAVVQSMFPVRDLIKEYLAPAPKGRRVSILKELEKYEGGEPEYLAMILRNMTPPQSPDLKEYSGEKPLEFEVTVRGTKIQKEAPQKFKFLVHLPPEYDPYRKYPCLLTLRSGDSVEKQLERWAGKFNPNLGIRNGRAIRQGYIVVSLDWKLPGQGAYEYSAREHKAILKCLRSCLKKFSIDSDAVFLTGHGFGADAAYDVAISHPEHWAGVIGIAGKIDKYPIQYFRNEHLKLNVYSVVGTKDLDSISKSAKAWNEWLNGSRYNRCMVVQYEGRVGGPFFDEFPEILKWCDLNRRSWPSKGTKAFEIDCKILRPWDNYYWFIELEGIPSSKVLLPEQWRNQKGFKPLKISAKLDTSNNTFKNVRPSNQGTGINLWLSPDYIDFKEKVVVEGRGRFNKIVDPSRETMLEDVRIRGDRKRPFWAKIHIK